MLTWDLNNALSREVPLMLDIADMLSECAGFQRLNNDSNAAEALEKIKVGPSGDPWEDAVNGKATLAELQAMLLRASIRPAQNDPHDVTESTARCPNEGGTFELHIRRQITDEELEENTENDLYLAFSDCVSSIAHELMEDAALSKTLKQIRVTEPGLFGSNDKLSAQGVYLFATLEIDWGDRGASAEAA